MPEHSNILPLDDDEELRKYTVEAKTEIAAVFNFLRTNNERVTVYFHHGDDFFLSSVVAITADGSELVLDACSDDEKNKRVLRAEKLTCISSQGKVKIQFVVHGVDPTKFEGRSAFLGNVPEALVRVQRREFLRMKPPVANPLKCDILIQEADGSSRSIIASVADISAGGVALVLPANEPHLEIGALLSNCLIDLPNVGKVKAAIQVCSAYDVHLGSGKILKRSGGKFIKLPDAMTSLIQRYIIQVDRERRSRSDRDMA